MLTMLSLSISYRKGMDSTLQKKDQASSAGETLKEKKTNSKLSQRVEAGNEPVNGGEIHKSNNSQNSPWQRWKIRERLKEQE